MLKKEYDVEQIDLISKFLFKILFPKGFDADKFTNFDFSENFLDLKINLENLILQNKFCEAEDLLFDQIECNNSSRSILQLGVWFFWKLNSFNDEILRKNNYSRGEVLKGFEDIEKMVVEL